MRFNVDGLRGVSSEALIKPDVKFHLSFRLYCGDIILALALGVFTPLACMKLELGVFKPTDCVCIYIPVKPVTLLRVEKEVGRLVLCIANGTREFLTPVALFYLKVGERDFLDLL